MFQFPLLSSVLQASGKDLQADQARPEGGLMALLSAADGESAGFSGELQAMLMQLAPPVLQRLDELLADGKSLPQAARMLLGEFAADGDGQPFPDLLHKLAKGMRPTSRVELPGQAVLHPPNQEAASLPAERVLRSSPPAVAQLSSQVGPTDGRVANVRATPTALSSAVTAAVGTATTAPEAIALGTAKTPVEAVVVGTATTVADTIAVATAPNAATTPIPAAISAGLPTPLTTQPTLPPQVASSLIDMGVPQSVGTKAWGEAVAQRVMWMVQGDQQFARLKLNPPNLGPLEVRVSVSQEQTNVAFLAQHAAVREALEAALPRLREMFDQSSLQLVRADVSDPGAQQGGRSGGSTADQAARQGTGGSSQAGGEELGSDEPPAVTGSGLVDLFA